MQELQSKSYSAGVTVQEFTVQELQFMSYNTGVTVLELQGLYRDYPVWPMLLRLYERDSNRRNGGHKYTQHI